MIEYKIILVIEYKQLIPVGINSFTYHFHEWRTEINDYWFLQDALNSFRMFGCPKHGTIVSIRKEFKEINKSRNHHNRVEEIVLGEPLTSLGKLRRNSLMGRTYQESQV